MLFITEKAQLIKNIEESMKQAQLTIALTKIKTLNFERNILTREVKQMRNEIDRTSSDNTKLKNELEQKEMDIKFLLSDKKRLITKSMVSIYIRNDLTDKIEVMIKENLSIKQELQRNIESKGNDEQLEFELCAKVTEKQGHDEKGKDNVFNFEDGDERI